MKTRPNSTTVFMLHGWKIIIFLKPQQKWCHELVNGIHRLKRDNVYIEMPDEEYDRYFREDRING